MATWQCVKFCGACCNLNPSDRPDLEKYLTPEELKQYLGMVGENSWCIHYDRVSRSCKIYEARPRFCRVKPEIFEQMYGIERKDFNDFAIACCRQQIEGVYGWKSEEMLHYNGEVNDSEI